MRKSRDVPDRETISMRRAPTARTLGNALTSLRFVENWHLCKFGYCYGYASRMQSAFGRMLRNENLMAVLLLSPESAWVVLVALGVKALLSENLEQNGDTHDLSSRWRW